MEKAPEKLELRFEDSSRKVWRTADAERLIIEYGNSEVPSGVGGEPEATIRGDVNNRVSARLFEYLQEHGIPTHFLGLLNEREMLVRSTETLPVRVTVRNRAAGEYARRYGVAEGLQLEPTVIEWSYRSTQLGNPPMNDATAVALGFASEEELELMFELAIETNEQLLPFFAGREIDLVDLALEFGRTGDGGIILAGELSLETCRLRVIGEDRHEEGVTAEGSSAGRDTHALLLARIEGEGRA